MPCQLHFADKAAGSRKLNGLGQDLADLRGPIRWGGGPTAQDSKAGGADSNGSILLSLFHGGRSSEGLERGSKTLKSANRAPSASPGLCKLSTSSPH